jgi:hypothetical protein
MKKELSFRKISQQNLKLYSLKKNSYGTQETKSYEHSMVPYKNMVMPIINVYGHEKFQVNIFPLLYHSFYPIK